MESLKNNFENRAYHIIAEFDAFGDEEVFLKDFSGLIRELKEDESVGYYNFMNLVFKSRRIWNYLNKTINFPDTQGAYVTVDIDKIESLPMQSWLNQQDLIKLADIQLKCKPFVKEFVRSRIVDLLPELNDDQIYFKTPYAFNKKGEIFLITPGIYGPVGGVYSLNPNKDGWIELPSGGRNYLKWHNPYEFDGIEREPKRPWIENLNPSSVKNMAEAGSVWPSMVFQRGNRGLNFTFRRKIIRGEPPVITTMVPDRKFQLREGVPYIVTVEKRIDKENRLGGVWVVKPNDSSRDERAYDDWVKYQIESKIFSVKFVHKDGIGDFIQTSEGLIPIYSESYDCVPNLSGYFNLEGKKMQFDYSANGFLSEELLTKLRKVADDRKRLVGIVGSRQDKEVDASPKENHKDSKELLDKQRSEIISRCLNSEDFKTLYLEFKKLSSLDKERSKNGDDFFIKHLQSDPPSVSIGNKFEGKRWFGLANHQGVYACQEDPNHVLTGRGTGLFSEDERREELETVDTGSYIRRLISGVDVFKIKEKMNSRLSSSNLELASKTNDLYKKTDELLKKMITDACGDEFNLEFFLEDHEVNSRLRGNLVVDSSYNHYDREDSDSWLRWKNKHLPVSVEIDLARNFKPDNVCYFESADGYKSYAYQALVAKRVDVSDGIPSFTFELDYFNNKIVADSFTDFSNDCLLEIDKTKRENSDIKESLRLIEVLKVISKCKTEEPPYLITTVIRREINKVLNYETSKTGPLIIDSPSYNPSFAFSEISSLVDKLNTRKKRFETISSIMEPYKDEVSNLLDKLKKKLREIPDDRSNRSIREPFLIANLNMEKFLLPLVLVDSEDGMDEGKIRDDFLVCLGQLRSLFDESGGGKKVSITKKEEADPHRSKPAEKASLLDLMSKFNRK